MYRIRRVKRAIALYYTIKPRLTQPFYYDIMPKHNALNSLPVSPLLASLMPRTPAKRTGGGFRTLSASTLKTYPHTTKTAHARRHEPKSMNKTAKVQSLIDLFDLQQRPEHTCEECKHTEERRSWYSFKLDAISSKSPAYEAMSDLIQSHGVDQNSAYDWTVEALGVIHGALENGTKIDDDSIQDDLQQAADEGTDIYFYDQALWLSKGSNWSYLDEAVANGAEGSNIMAYAQVTAREEVMQNTLDAVRAFLAGKQ